MAYSTLFFQNDILVLFVFGEYTLLNGTLYRQQLHICMDGHVVSVFVRCKCVCVCMLIVCIVE